MSGVIDHVNLKVSLDSMLLNTLDVESGQSSIVRNLLFTLTNGTASGQASQQWSDTRTLTASATENLDLAASLVNVYGVTLTFTKLKLILVEAASANTNDVQVARGATLGVPLFLAASDAVSVTPGGIFLFYSPVGVTVTAATGDILTFTNSAGSTSVTYTVTLIGTD